MPCLGVDGLIYPCFRFTSLSIPKEIEKYSVGDIWSGFYKKEKFRELREQNRERVSPDKCKSCFCESGCSWCIAGAYMESGTFFRQTHICDVHKTQVKYAKKYWDAFVLSEGYRNYYGN